MKKTPGIPDLGIDLKKKKKKSDEDSTNAALIRRMKRTAQANARRSKTQKENRAVEVPVVQEVMPKIIPTTSAFQKMVERVNKITEIAKLKKIIYNRNYRINKQYKEQFPDKAQERLIMKFPPTIDIRVVGQATFKRLNKIKDPDKLIEELKKLIINTTRHKNIPKTAADYSNKEQDYLSNGVNALQAALNSWGDDLLANKLKGAFDNITMADIINIFKTAPSYWAISSGFYYAVTDFDDFMQEIFALIHRSGVELTKREESLLTDRLFSNDPRNF